MSPARARRLRRALALLVVPVAALLWLAVPAAAAPSGEPVRIWSVSRIEQGAGAVPVRDGAQVGGKLEETADVGRVVFNLPLHAPYWYFLPRDRAFGSLFSSPDGRQYSVLAQAPPPNPMRVGAPKGAVTHLDQYQAFEKQADDASLRITLSDLLLQTIDDNNGPFGAWECPDQGPCDPVRTVVRFHARAYAASAGGDFFSAGGVAYLEGHQHSWRPGAATSADAPGPLWGEEDFDVDGDADDSGTGAAGVMSLNKSRSVKVPLASIPPGELFAVHVSLEAQAVDDRGGESAAQAFIQDPQHGERGLLLTAHGLRPRGKPRFKEPPLGSPPPARCPDGRPRGAGALQLSDPGYTVNESESAPLVLVTRTGGAHGTASVTLTARAGSAQAGQDFKAVTRTVTFGDGDTSPRLVEVPLLEDQETEPAETFTVSLGHARCAGLGAQHTAPVTIVDDDQGAPSNAPPSAPGGGGGTGVGGSTGGGAPTSAPTPSFTIGGTVDGLQGSGLVLSNFGEPLPVSANGRFTFSGTRSAGQSYEVVVATQPSNPDQVCTVEHGAGTVGGADVSDIAVHCATIATPAGLDRTFGTDGRVSTPVGNGQGQAVVIQPSGGIVTAGWRGTAGIDGDFALTRHDPAGNLDPTFGDLGLAVTDLGGKDDEAQDAALTPDGGIVAVGRTDKAGTQNTDFALVRYLPDGMPDPGFGSGGIMTTDVLAGHASQANAVAVQPDGKIVVAGLAAAPPRIDTDFALARYNADGSPDMTFGDHGIMTTDFGTRSDDARALVLQSDGRIVVVGTAGDDLALARYTTDGHLDGTFGQAGKTTTAFGTEALANGVALTATGQILIAGTTLGAKPDRDFLLARYSADGSPDATFGNQGIVKTDLGSGDDFAENITTDAQGRIVLVGRATSPTILDMALVRYLPDGSLDTSFDGDGILTADFHGKGEFGQDVALDAQGRIIAAGYTANGGETEFALMRANP